MTVYGNFEAISQVFKTHHGSIWSARTAGTEEPADCSIKLLELNQAMLDKRDTTLAQNLLVSAALQQAMGNKSEFWAPVYGLGSQGTNAFYASRLFPRSLQSIIDHETPLTSAELKIIMLAVVDGLMDLDTAFHRAHTNLKPSNVLLDDAQKIREGGVLLCDPDASTEDVASLTRTPDSKAVGELIYSLVTHRPHSTARWPLPKSEKWNALGSTGRQWRSLCESLLNTVSRRGLPTLEHLRDQIDAIRPTRRRTPKAVFALLGLAIIGAAAYARRDQLPGWYHHASAKVMALLPSKNSKLPPHNSTIPPIVASNEPVAPKIDPAVPVDPVKPIPAPTTTLVPVTPTIVRPVVVTPAPTPLVDQETLKAIQNTAPPEFHSDAAKSEFIHNRDQFVAAHAGTASTSLLGEWERILAKTQGIDADYPPLDPAATAGWPAGLAAVINARRDAMMSQAVDQAFLQQSNDPSAFQITFKRVQTAGNAVVNAHDALARGDIKTAKKSIALCNAALKDFPPGDADLGELFGPVKKEFGALEDVDAITDRTALLGIVDNDGASLAVRLSAWLHAGTVSADPWPSDIPSLADEQTRAARLNTALQEVGSVDLSREVNNTESTRLNGFFARLRDQASVVDAVKQASDPHYAPLLAKSPVWFRYDAALYVLRTTNPTDLTDEQKKAYSDLAGQVDAPGVQLIHDVLKTAVDKPPLLSQCGPGSVKGWQMRSGATRDHCSFICPGSGDTLEFLHVHVPDQADCYLCTTETPVALMQHLLKGDAASVSTMETLNASSSPLKPGMRVWSFDNKSVSVDLDDEDYSKCFVVSPADQLPVQIVTPQAAFYLSRRVGCRLPTSHEWTAAYTGAKNSSNANMRGFATLGWKVRDREFAKLLTNPNRDTDYWPDDNIFLGNLDPSKVKDHANAGIWTTSALAAIGGSAASDTSSTPLLWPLSSLQSSGGFGFRTVGDSENFSGVFHDLIGNVAEYAMDQPALLAEKVPVTPPLSKDEIVRHVNDWFSPPHMATVSVIGGSALSPPDLDPTKPYPLPKDQNQFADVGFRLAFTDPASLPNAQRELIAQAPYLTAP